MPTTPLFNNPRINLLLLIDITVLTYLLVFVSGFSSLDDTGLLAALQKHDLTLASLIQFGGMTYLRPLTSLTYLADYYLWGANAAAFHLTSLALHTANACLVYQLCRAVIFDPTSRESSALLAALFFAVSPLNSESVLWVSGRTDILCCFFFLVSLLVLVDARLSSWSASAAFFAAYFCSLLAKESSIAILGIVPIYLLVADRARPWPARIALGSTAIAASASYLVLRLGPKGQVDSGIMKIASQVIGRSVPELAVATIAAIGFYLKKLLWPFPLNLAIETINEPLYLVAGISAVAGGAILFLRWRAARLPLLVISGCLVPPLLALHGSIPWTPYAERYLYLPMTGAALLFSLALNRCRPAAQLLAFLLIFPLALATVHRSAQWAEPVELWRDTAAKSPLFPQAQVVYAYELIQAGRISEAEAAIAKARNMNYDNELLQKCIESIKGLQRQRAAGQ